MSVIIKETTYTKFMLCDDKKGNNYNKCFARVPVQAVLCYDNVNSVFKGSLNFFVRKGGVSGFGDQLVIQFIINEKLGSYLSKSDTSINNFEIYLTEGFGKKFLSECLDHFEGCDHGKNY